MPHESHWFRPDIEVAASRYGLDPDLVEAIVRVESSGLTHAYRYEDGFYRRYLADNPAYDGANPRRVSSSYGLMQVMYPTAKEELGFTDSPEHLFVPTVGLDAGCAYLARLRKRTGGDLDRAIAAYNGGIGNSRRPFPPVVAIYVHKVNTALDTIRKERSGKP
jgi:soluble lytic murein transglycosylase-like protein